MPAAQRLGGVWYDRADETHKALAKGWPAALTGETPPAGWMPCTSDPQRGTVGRELDERPHWFAAPFFVSSGEAQGPARLMIDTTGGAVPADLIKTVWVNGQPSSGSSSRSHRDTNIEVHPGSREGMSKSGEQVANAKSKSARQQEEKRHKQTRKRIA